MLTGLTIITALVCVLLTLAILIQNPKGGGIDSTFGGSQATQMFGAAKQSDFIEKVTWYLAIALLILCIASTFVVGTATGVEDSLQLQ
jgi:preprotein translocase subunit SecG